MLIAAIREELRRTEGVREQVKAASQMDQEAALFAKSSALRWVLEQAGLEP